MLARALALSTFIAAFAPQAAFADCEGSHAVDRCLLGTWKMTQSGAEKWMHDNLHIHHTISTQVTNNTITFTADGKFQTGKINLNAQVVDEDHENAAFAHMEAQSSGTWAAHDGHLDMCTAHRLQNGSIRLQDGEGNSINAPMAHMPMRNGHVAYTCTGAKMTITQPMPRHTTVTSIYVRLH